MSMVNRIGAVTLINDLGPVPLVVGVFIVVVVVYIVWVILRG